MEFEGDIKQENEDDLEDNDNLEDGSESIMYPKIELRVKDGIFICYVCGKSFGNKGDMKKHISRIHESVPGSVVCDQCPKTFKNSGDLYHHKAQVHTHEILKCERCFVDCKNKNALRKHVKKCSKKEVPSPIILCQFCDQTFSIHKTLYKHLKQQHNHIGREFKCDVCEKQYDRQLNLTRHIKRHHGEYIGEPMVENCGSEIVSLVENSKSMIQIKATCTKNSESMSDSKESVVENSGYLYDTRGFNAFDYILPEDHPPDFKCKVSLHLDKNDVIPPSNDILEKIIDPVTRKQYISDIIEHIKTETPSVKTESKYSDESDRKELLDEESFASMVKEHVHTTRNHDEKADTLDFDPESEVVKKISTKNLCDICARCFAHKAALKKHILTAHLKEEDNAICELCSKVFKYKHLLQYHTRDVHSTQLFSCEVCGKTFKSKSYLSRHLERHTTDLIHPCPLCDKTFSNKSYLRHHRNAVHNLEDNPCETCGKMYKNKYLLRKHVNKYHLNK